MATQNNIKFLSNASFDKDVAIAGSLSVQGTTIAENAESILVILFLASLVPEI